jgi:hypothetical protein
VNNTGPNAATQMNSESALRHAYAGIVQLAPMSAIVDGTRLPVVSPAWHRSRKTFADVSTQIKGSPQSRGRLAHT